MRFTTVIASALTAASVIAAPLERRAIVTSWVIEVVTKTSTIYGVPKPTVSPIGGLQKGGASKPSVSKPAPPPAPTTTPFVPPPAPSTTPVEVAPPPPSTTPVAPAPAPAPSPSPPASGGSGPADYGSCQQFAAGSTPDFNTPPVSCGVSVMDTVNKWRRLYNKPDLTWSSTMAQAAWATLEHNRGGVTMVHPGLIDGSMGETITPGFYVPGPNMQLQGDSPFEVALMGWLCEVGSDPQLQKNGPTGIDQCDISHNQASISGDVDGGTGHHDIFLGDYSNIGCGYRNNDDGDGGWPQFAGQWTCDFS